MYSANARWEWHTYWSVIFLSPSYASGNLDIATKRSHGNCKLINSHPFRRTPSSTIEEIDRRVAKMPGATAYKTMVGTNGGEGAPRNAAQCHYRRRKFLKGQKITDDEIENIILLSYELHGFYKLLQFQPKNVDCVDSRSNERAVLSPPDDNDWNGAHLLWHNVFPRWNLCFRKSTTILNEKHVKWFSDSRFSSYHVHRKTDHSLCHLDARHQKGSLSSAFCANLIPRTTSPRSEMCARHWLRACFEGGFSNSLSSHVVIQVLESWEWKHQIRHQEILLLEPVYSACLH